MSGSIKCRSCGWTGDISDCNTKRIDGESIAVCPNCDTDSISIMMDILEKKSHHCNICGGTVDLSNATKPTSHIGRGGKE